MTRSKGVSVSEDTKCFDSVHGSAAAHAKRTVSESVQLVHERTHPMMETTDVMEREKNIEIM